MQLSTKQKALGHGILLWIILLCAYFIYQPGVSGVLLLDDFWNLQPLGANEGITSLDNLKLFVFGNTSGPTGRPVSMLSFVMDSQDWPPNIPALKYTNILIHLLIGVFVFWFSMQLASLLENHEKSFDSTPPAFSDLSIRIGLLAAALWLLHPFNVSTTLYVIQRMTQLMTLFAMMAMVCYSAARISLPHNPRRACLFLVLCLFPCGLLSVFSKENGALLLLLIVICEQTFFRNRPSTYLFRIWYRAGVLFPLFIVFAYLIYSYPDDLAVFDIRRFGPIERLLTETRILVTYLWEIFLPNMNGNGLFHDDVVISRSLLSPITTLLSSIVLLIIFASSWYLRKRQPVYSFAVFWFFGLHLVESTVLPLELYFEHRNYFPMIGPVFAVSWYVSRLLWQGENDHQKQSLIILVAIVLGFNSWLTWNTSKLWGDTLGLHVTWAEESPNSIRAQISLAEQLNVLGLPEEAMKRLELAHSNYPQEVTVQLQIWNQACAYDLPTSISVAGIADSNDLEYGLNDVNQQLQVFLENMFTGMCQYPDFELTERLFVRVSELPMTEGRRASFYALFADLYVLHGRLDNALINLTRAFQIRPLPDIPIKQAIMSASAGNFSDSLIFLQRARDALVYQHPMAPSAEPEIDRLEADFSARVSQSQ